MSTKTPKKKDSSVRQLEGRRILLRGFNASEERLAKKTVLNSGGTVVQSLQAADLVILGAEAAPTVAELARRKRLKVLPWADLASDRPEGPEPNDEPIQVRSAVEYGSDHLRILDVRLPYPGRPLPSEPPPDRFSHLCLDEPFLKAARAVALGAAQRLPTALEGITAASKTTVVLWVAHLLGHPVLRLNLHGQTDTGELVGRYVPTRAGEEWDGNSLTAVRPWLKPESLALLDRAANEGRALSLPERAFLTAREGFRDRTWRFAEGILPQALRSGAWVLLDELNLAEPQILERLNPVLESPPSLLLSEGDQTRWGLGGLPVHGQFRLFATLNPAEYAGRSVLSPAFRDRWLHWFSATSTGESEYTAQLRFLIHGIQPLVTIHRTRYQAANVEPLLDRLREVPEVDALIQALAQFHTALAMGGGDSGHSPVLGRHRRERYVFTRRSLEACSRLWNALRRDTPHDCPRSQLATALSTVYLNKLSAGSDRKAAIGMAQVAGLPVEDAP